MTTYQPSFFDESDRFQKLDKLKDPLGELSQHIDFEIFRATLEEAFPKPSKSNAGRKRIDCVLMFKILILQRFYNLSDQQAEFQINDRLSFSRFVGLPLGGAVPDFSTVWRFREALVISGSAKTLFELFAATLDTKGLIAREGTMVDASFVEVPKQRNSREENELVKSGKTPEDWKDKPAKLRQKDLDARWTKKNGVSYYGYKDHVKADAHSKLITRYAVTAASVHDSRALFDLVDADCSGEKLFADSAYKSAAIEQSLSEIGVESFIHEKGSAKAQLSEAKQELNRLKSKVRCRVEHIFGYIENSMGGPELRYIGFARNAFGIGLCNLAYNMKRYIQIVRPQKSIASR